MCEDDSAPAADDIPVEMTSRGDGSHRRKRSRASVEIGSHVSTNGACSSNTKKRNRVLSLSYVSSKGTIKHVFDVISKFCEKKKSLVEAIGFGGLLHFPPLRQVNRRFALWVMSIVDPLSQTMVIDCTRIISFDKEDVARVFGIPCGGNLVSQLSMTQDEVISKVMDGYLGSQLRDYRSIKSVQEVVERDYGSTMTIEEENAFKGAFVIYVVSMILSPGTKYDHTSFDYWDALVDPSAIHTFDWCDYVICRLFDAVVKVKSDIRGNCKAACITGCSLFLQVLYLDSIDIGVLKLQHNSFPRVRHFGQTTMNSMILADTLTDFDDMTGCLFGKSKFRPHGEVCYYWASNPRRHFLSQLNQTPCTLWESARLFAEDLLLPGEASAPFFFLL